MTLPAELLNTMTGDCNVMWSDSHKCVNVYTSINQIYTISVHQTPHNGVKTQPSHNSFKIQHHHHKAHAIVW